MGIFSLAESFKIYTNPGNSIFISASQFLKKNGSISYTNTVRLKETQDQVHGSFRSNSLWSYHLTSLWAKFCPSARCAVQPNYLQNDEALDKEMSILKSLVQGLESGHLMEAGPKISQFSASSHEKSKGPNLWCTWPFPHASVFGTWAATSNVFPRLYSGFLISTWLASSTPLSEHQTWTCSCLPERTPEDSSLVEHASEICTSSCIPHVSSWLPYTKALDSYTGHLHVLLKSSFSPPPPTDHQILCIYLLSLLLQRSCTNPGPQNCIITVIPCH